MALSRLARALLSRIQERPDLVRYDIGPLGSMFHPGDLDMLDAAYKELSDAGLVEFADDYVSFFGTPKRLYRLSEQGRASVSTPA